MVQTKPMTPYQQLEMLYTMNKHGEQLSRCDAQKITDFTPVPYTRPVTKSWTCSCCKRQQHPSEGKMHSAYDASKSSSYCSYQCMKGIMDVRAEEKRLELVEIRNEFADGN